MQKADIGAQRGSVPRIKGGVSFDEPMSLHTSFRIGGPADIFAVPQDVSDLLRLLDWARNGGFSVTVVGAGTNLLVSDKGIRGLVLRLGSGFGGISIRGVRIVTGSAVELPLLVKRALDVRLAGLEGLSGVPGTVGGAVYTNAGTPVGCVGDVLESVLAVDLAGRVSEFDACNLGLCYRQSNVGEMGLIITEAAFRLHKGLPQQINEVEASLRGKRDETQPHGSKTAGSTFKNPPSGHAGQMIEAVGAKGMRVGGAQVSTVHANFIENVENASASDVRELIAHLHGLVRDRFGVELQPEIRFVGEW